MARRKVRVNPLQKTMGEDYIEDPLQKTMGEDYIEDEVIENLSYIDPDQGIDPSGTAMPEMTTMPSDQQFRDVPRQAPIRDDFQEENLDGIDLLGDVAQNEAYEDSLDAVAETEPPEMYQQPEEQQIDEIYPEVSEDQPQEQQIDDVDEPLNMIMSAIETYPEIQMLLPYETRQMLKNGSPEEIEVRRREVAEMLKPQIGAIEAALNDDKIMEALRVMDGLDQPYDKETIENVVEMTNMFNKREEDRTAREQQLADSLLSGNLTSQEIVALGIATVVPALLALFYGKEAALGAMAGGLRGASEFFKSKQPDKKEIRKELKEISDERKKDRIDNVEIKKKIMENVKSPKMRNFLENRHVKVFKEDKTIGVPIDEKYNLYLDVSKVNNDSDYEKWDKDLKKDKEALAIQMDVNESLEQIKDLMLEMQKQNPSLYTIVADNFKGYIPKSWRDLTPEGLKFLKTQPINVLVNGEVRQVDPVRQLEQLLAKFQTAYINMNNMDNRLTNNVKDHLSDVLPNPGSFLQWFSQDLDDFIEKVNTLKNESNRKFVTQSEINGYVATPLKAMFPYGDYKVVDQDAVTKSFKSVLSEPEKYTSKVVR